MQQPYPPPITRNLITLFSLLSAFMTQLDATIANVALPHMQASVSASREQITWVLTSYLIMAAIFTPLSGWLAGRIGRKALVLGSTGGFTIASVMCGMAANFDQLVAFRMIQGMMGAAILPMSQALMFDINPPEKHGPAMAVWGMGVVLGPIAGPVLGGWLTDNYSWRWVFLINIPFGIIAFLGILALLPDTGKQEEMRLDWFGFAMLALAIGCFQLVLDRGESQDWFNSTEIWIEATLSAMAFYLFLVHSLTADKPFVNLALFRDTNFVVGSVFGFFLGGLLYGVLALLPPLLANLMGYPIVLVGLVTAPRGIGTMIGMGIAGQLMRWVDVRLLIFAGMMICGLSTLMMSGFSVDMDSWPVITSGVVQGIGAGLLFVPITTVVFATIPASYRNEGAAMNSLIRGLSSALWISVLQTVTIRNEAAVHSRLSEGVRPDNPVLGLLLPDFDFGGLRQVAMMHGEIGRQAMMVSYIDTFWLLFIASLVIAPLVVLLRPERPPESQA
jgi:DHA2 family multidrug resistance protein